MIKWENVAPYRLAASQIAKEVSISRDPLREAFVIERHGKLYRLSQTALEQLPETEKKFFTLLVKEPQ